MKAPGGLLGDHLIYLEVLIRGPEISRTKYFCAESFINSQNETVFLRVIKERLSLTSLDRKKMEQYPCWRFYLLRPQPTLFCTGPFFPFVCRFRRGFCADAHDHLSIDRLQGPA